MSDLIHERANSIESTKNLWLEVVQKHRLKYRMKDCVVNGFTTHLCYLASTNWTVRGAGKGHSLLETEVSSCYEAIEYYLAGSSFHPTPFIVGSASQIESSYPLLLERCDTARFMTEANQHDAVPWVLYKDIKTDKEHAAPLVCVDLSYRSSVSARDKMDYEICNAYAASNGLASGATREEAIIHGILELLERDAHSYFVIDTWILEKPPSLVNKATLPDDLIALIANIEKSYKNKITLFKTPSRFGVFAYVAVFRNKDFSIQPRGCGASFDSKYALERAVLELVQQYNLMHGYYLDRTLNPIKIGNNDLVKKILEFDLSNIFIEQHDFYDNSAAYRLMTLPLYLDKLIELVHDQASSILVNEVYTDANGLSCSRVIIPGAEEFFLATHYLKLTPKTRTALYIERELGKQFVWDDFIL